MMGLALATSACDSPEGVEVDLIDLERAVVSRDMSAPNGGTSRVRAENAMSRLGRRRSRLSLRKSIVPSILRPVKT